jgi:hypothetical protein
MHETMKAALAALLVVCPAGVSAATYQSNARAVLEGTLITARAAPAVTYDEKPHAFPALRLAQPIDFSCARGDEMCEPESNVGTLQLVLDAGGMAKFKALKGKPAKVAGKLWHSENGHHFTKVLLEVESISP